jgi:uncharacterized OB-fold protein
LRELLIQRCDRCGIALFPDRLRCPRCGASGFTRVAAGSGVVEEQTTLPSAGAGDEREVRLGSVRLLAGPVVVARLDERDTTGAVVHLMVDSGGAIRGSRTEAGAAPAPGQ